MCGNGLSDLKCGDFNIHHLFFFVSFIVQNNDVKKVKKFSKQHSALNHIRVVELTKNDCGAMGLQV